MGIKVVNQYVETHPVTGMPFKNGFPDFSSVATHTVQIEQTGKNAMDFAKANEAAGLTATPKGYTWHHVEDGTTMQLVPMDIHGATGHTGGAALARATAAAGGAAAAGDAQASDGGILGSGITFGDVGNFLIDFLVPGGVGNAGGASDMMPVNTPQPAAGRVSWQQVPDYSSSGAAGGFLIYPNKPNTNQLQSVYSK